MDTDPVSRRALTTAQVRYWGLVGLRELKQGCKDLFSETKGPDGKPLLSQLTEAIQFVDAVDPFDGYNGHIRLSWISTGAYGTDPTLFEYVSQVPNAIMAAIPNSNTIVLGPRWATWASTLNGSNFVSQNGAAVVHEMLHILFNKDDAWMATQLAHVAIPEGPDPLYSRASAAWDGWLAGGCNRR